MDYHLPHGGNPVKGLIHLALHRWPSSLLITLALAILGGIAGAALPVTSLPSLGLPRATVSVSLPGYPAEEVRSLVTCPLEKALGSLQGLRQISSLSRDSRALIVLEFPWKKNMTRAAVEIRQLAGNIRGSLPSAAEAPQVLPAQPDIPPLMILNLFPQDGKDLPVLPAFSELRYLAEGPIRTSLQQVPGVGSISLTGGAEKEIQLRPDPARLSELGLTPNGLARQISGETRNYPAGRISGPNREFLIKIQSRFSRPENLLTLPVQLPSGGTVPLKEIAEAVPFHRRIHSFHSLNGRPGIALTIRCQEGADPLQTAARLRGRIRELRGIYSTQADMTISLDSTRNLRKQRRDILISVLFSSLLVGGLLLAAGGGFRQALIPACSIPISLSLTLLALGLLGKSLNVMTLSGLAVGIGLLVDNSLVILDSLQGLPRDDPQALAAAAARSTGSIFSSTLTTLAVFLPLFFLPGVMGPLYQGLALSLSLSLVSSLIAAPLLVPLLYHILPGRTAPPEREQSQAHRIYRPLLAGILRKPIAAVFLLLLLAGCGSVSLFRLDTEIFPSINRGRLSLDWSFPPGTRLSVLAEASAAAAPLLLQDPAVQSVLLQGGGEPDDTALLAREDYHPSRIRGTVILDPSRYTSLSSLQDRLNTRLRGEISPHISLSPPPHILTPLLGIQPHTWKYRIPLSESQDLPAVRGRIRKALAGYQERGRYQILPPGGQTEIRLSPQRDRQILTGLSSRKSAEHLYGLTMGAAAAPLKFSGRLIPLRIVSPELKQQSPEKLLSAPYPLSSHPAGGGLPPGEWLQISREETAGRLLRQNLEDSLFITSGRPLPPPVLQELRHLGLEPERADQTILAQEGRRLAALFLLALFLVYTILGARFESFVLPLLILFLVPLAFLGGCLALSFFDESLNLSSLLGGLVLLGLLVNNAILLTEESRRQSAFPVEAVFRGASRRLRPILITTGTTLLALLPLAIDPSNQSAQSSLAAVILGGLTTSSALTLLILPLLLLGLIRSPRRTEKKGGRQGERGDR